jgi:hypothetical protein
MGQALRAGAVLALAALLAGCGGGATYLSDFCLQAKPLRPNAAAWAAADRSFKEEIVLHNETGAALCGWMP